VRERCRRRASSGRRSAVVPRWPSHAQAKQTGASPRRCFFSRACCCSPSSRTARSATATGRGTPRAATRTDPSRRVSVSSLCFVRVRVFLLHRRAFYAGRGVRCARKHKKTSQQGRTSLPPLPPPFLFPRLLFIS
jgi:hypothetical protein